MTGIINGIQEMIAFFASLWDFIKMIVGLVINLVKSLISLVEMLITTVANTTTLIATLPPWLIAFATATMTVAVLYIILGRENGK